MKLMRPLLLTLALAGSTALYLGCEIDSADTFVRNVSFDFTGYYGPRDGRTRIVDGNTGAAIRNLDLRQTGDQLEGIDNNGAIWRGSLGEVRDNGGQFQSSFTLEGRTTVGREAIWTGNLRSSGSDASDAIMEGTWIEDDVYGTFTAEGSVAGPAPDDGDNGGTNTNGSSTNASIWMRSDLLLVAQGLPGNLWFMRDCASVLIDG